MKHDISIIQNESEVIYNGVKTTVYPFVCIPVAEYHATRDENSDPTFDHFLCDWFGDEYVALQAWKLTQHDADAIGWDNIYVEINEKPLHITSRYGVYPISEIDTPRSLGDLSFEDALQLRKQVCIGSCYLADFENSFCVDRNDVSDACEAFQCHQEDIYGEYDADNHLTADEFAEFITSNY